MWPDRHEVIALHGCPHCTFVPGSCCQCLGTRLVEYDVAQRNVAWLWDWSGCDCAACLALRAQRPREEVPVPVTVEKPKGERAANCGYCGKMRALVKGYCSRRCDISAEVVARRKRNGEGRPLGTQVARPYL